MTAARRRLSAELRERAETHVLQLARRLGAQVVFSARHRGIDAVVDFETKRITGPHITSASEYLSWLHELGHLGSRSKSSDEIVDEGAAWAWAARRADPEIMRRMTATEWRDIGAAFVSYVKHYAVRAA